MQSVLVGMVLRHAKSGYVLKVHSYRLSRRRYMRDAYFMQHRRPRCCAGELDNRIRAASGRHLESGFPSPQWKVILSCIILQVLWQDPSDDRNIRGPLEL